MPQGATPTRTLLKFVYYILVVVDTSIWGAKWPQSSTWWVRKAFLKLSDLSFLCKSRKYVSRVAATVKFRYNGHVSLGAQKVLYAFRCALSFSTVFGQLECAEFKKIGLIICIWGNSTAHAVKCCARPHKAISAHEGHRPLNMRFKMTAIIDLVGTQRNFKALDCSVFV